MSLILKEINLPKEGNSIIIEVFPCGSCSVMKVEKGECHELEIVSDVQAIQIPKGHGRLIDASTETTVKSMSGEAIDVGMLLIALKQYAPTIFEAEE